jgi:hypothetical protein
LQYSDVPPLDEYTPVEVRWIDSAGVEGWLHPRELRATLTQGVMQCRTVGHYFASDEQSITVVLNIHTQGDEVTGIGEAITIPLVAVLAVEPLRYYFPHDAAVG